LSAVEAASGGADVRDAGACVDGGAAAVEAASGGADVRDAGACGDEGAAAAAPDGAGADAREDVTGVVPIAVLAPMFRIRD
jgi:hypothetical protein